jgi:hypothetical protein
VLTTLALLGGGLALMVLGFIIGHEIGWDAAKYDTTERMQKWEREVRR